MPALASARRAASAPSVAEESDAAAIRRSWMPVRWAIHSSLVSTIVAISSLLITRSGTCEPMPIKATRWPQAAIMRPAPSTRT